MRVVAGFALERAVGRRPAERQDVVVEIARRFAFGAGEGGEVGPDGRRLEVRAAGLNGADLSQRKGTYAMPPGVTDIPGLEVE